MNNQLTAFAPAAEITNNDPVITLSGAVVSAGLPYGWTADAGGDDTDDEREFVRIISDDMGSLPLSARSRVPLFVLTRERLGFSVTAWRLLPEHGMLDIQSRGVM